MVFLSLYGASILVNHLTKVYLLKLFELPELLSILFQELVDIFDIVLNLVLVLLAPLDHWSL